MDEKTIQKGISKDAEEKIDAKDYNVSPTRVTRQIINMVKSSEKKKLEKKKKRKRN